MKPAHKFAAVAFLVAVWFTVSLPDLARLDQLRDTNLAKVDLISGSRLLHLDKAAEAVGALEQYVHDSDDYRISTQYLLGKAYYASNDAARAGMVFFRSGVFKQIELLASQHQLTAVYSTEDLTMFDNAALAYAQISLSLKDLDSTEALLKFVTHLHSDSPVIVAKRFELAAELSYFRGQYQRAVGLARQSIDILPPESPVDPRYGWLRKSAMSQLLADNCVMNRANRLYALIVAYSLVDLNNVSETCLANLDQSVAKLGSQLEHAYYLRQRAIASRQAGYSAKSNKFLAQAETEGLPQIWSDVFWSRDSSSDIQTDVLPAYSVSSGSLVGYELDPVQVELGLPLDVILFYSNGRKSYRAKLIHVVNLAPNPGFEYEGSSNPCDIDGCRPLGFQADIYDDSAPAQVHVLVQTQRPLTPLPNAPAMQTNALLLDNALAHSKEGAMPNSSFASFPRSIAHTTYLQAGWIRSQGGNGFLGRVWSGTALQPPYSYVVGGYTSDAWLYQSALIVPPPDAFATQFWVLNYQAFGKIWADGLLLIRLP